MGLQTRTTAFSCDGDKKDYDESLFMSRPLPWVVRVYFKSESSMKGTLCSGMLYDVLKQRPNIRPKLNKNRRYYYYHINTFLVKFHLYIFNFFRALLQNFYKARTNVIKHNHLKLKFKGIGGNRTESHGESDGQTYIRCLNQTYIKALENKFPRLVSIETIPT